MPQICNVPLTRYPLNCALNGADFSGVYGITPTNNALRLNFVTKGSDTDIGSRVYLMDDNMKIQEFTFDVDMSNLPCSLDGAVYWTQSVVWPSTELVIATLNVPTRSSSSVAR